MMDHRSRHFCCLLTLALVPLSGCGGRQGESTPQPAPDAQPPAETVSTETPPEESPQVAPPQGGLGLRGKPAESGQGQKGILSYTPAPKGSLPKEEIRDTVHRNIQDIKDCYEHSLESHPALTGDVMVKFIIAVDGTVSMAAIAKTTLNLPELEACMAGAVKTWQFPKPQGGIVIVSYPFKLAPPPSAEKK